MALLETLLSTIGFSIAKSLVKVWLGQYPIAEGASLGVLQLIEPNATDALAARKAARRFEEIGDRVASALQPVFRSYKLRRSSYDAVATEVAAAIDASKITSRLLATINHEPDRLSAHIKKNVRSSAHPFTETETALLERSIDLSAQYIVDIAPVFSDYLASNFAEVLQRLDKAMGNADRVLEGLERLQSAAAIPDAERAHREFERDYRAAIIRRLDRVNLLGADISRETRRYQLSIAYVSLRVSGLEDEYDSPVENALYASSRAAIVGEAGSGKTTLLQWLAVKSASSAFPEDLSSWNDTIPFFIELRRYSDDLPAPKDFVQKVVPELADRIPAGWAHAILKSGKALLLIDGLDEVAPARRQGVVDWLEALSATYPKNRFVFTSRPAAFEQGLLDDIGFDVYQLSPMRIHQIEQFVDYWHESVLVQAGLAKEDESRTTSERLLSTLRTTPPVLRLATNPLLCAMVCALHYDRHMHLPSDRNALYEACTSMLLERRDVEREVTIDQYPPLTYKQKRVLLDDLAYWMLKNAYAEVRPSEALQRMRERVENMQMDLSSGSEDALLASLVERSGILRQPTEESLDFIHRTFQEYMAASALAREADWGLLLEHAADDQWREPLVLAIGFANKERADWLIRSLLQEQPHARAARSYYDLLAVACLETAVEISPEVRAMVDARLIDLIPPRETGQLKSLAAATDLAVPYLTNRSSFSEDEATACVQVLSMIGTHPALNALGTYALDNRARVACAFLEALEFATPEDVSESGLAESLFHVFTSQAKPPVATLQGPIASLLLLEPTERWTSAFPPGITHLHLIDCDDFPRPIGDFLSNVTSVSMRGQLPPDLKLLSGLTAISTLELIAGEEGFPAFRPIELMHKLEVLIIRMYGARWPAFEELRKLPRLRHLSLWSEYGDDFPELDELAPLTQIQSLRLSTSTSIWPDLAPLRQLTSLRRLTLATTSRRLPRTIMGIEELTHIAHVRLTLPGRPPGATSILNGLRALLPGCTIEITISSTPDDKDDLATA